MRTQLIHQTSNLFIYWKIEHDKEEKPGDVLAKVTV